MPEMDDESIERRAAKRAKKNYLDGDEAVNFIDGYVEMQKELRDKHATWRDCNHDHGDDMEGSFYRTYGGPDACDHTDDQVEYRYWADFFIAKESDLLDLNVAYRGDRERGQYEAAVFYRRKVMEWPDD